LVEKKPPCTSWHALSSIVCLVWTHSKI